MITPSACRVGSLLSDHTDHLDTPRLVADDTQKTVWRWEQQEPFGVNAANEDPDSDTVAFEFNLRFPGQYFDKETNAHYNYFRDYDPAIGRYVQSDPIGLRGGINPYSYANGDSLFFIDERGLRGKTLWQRFYEGLVRQRESGDANAGTELFEGIHTSDWVKAGEAIGRDLCKTPSVPNFAGICMERCVKRIPMDSRPSGGGGDEVSQCIDACMRTFGKCRQQPRSSCPPTPST